MSVAVCRKEVRLMLRFLHQCGETIIMRHLQTFKYVRAIVEAGSIRGAAETLAISPSALNRNIQALELDLGISVFDRLSRGVALSVEGELFYRFALEQLTSYDRMNSQIEAVKGLHIGKVTIGVSADIHTGFLVPLITEFKQEFPQVELSIQLVSQSDLEDQLVNGNIDFALFYQPQLSRNIKINFSKQVDICLMVPNGAKLGQDRTARLHHLEGLNLVTPPTHTELMAKFEGACERQDIEPTLYLSCPDQTQYLQQTPIALIGLAILPNPNQIGVVPVGYKVLKLHENDVGSGYINVVIERKRHLSFAASKFHERLTYNLDQ
ncbi:LysR family transcriptional regulator [Maritalea myrionectae]|uniref:LysR family transcriptional regulator n=1 Tax=Maritalea myrionectae TaxID=454601 RepID=UPI0012EC1AC9|nr:LysR family transcriptional regulator [Maritalea myrionectae]